MKKPMMAPKSKPMPKPTKPGKITPMYGTGTKKAC